MKTIIEVVAYTYRAGSHLTGIKTVAGRELRAGDALQASVNGARWRVKGLGTIAAQAHQAGIRALVLMPENATERLAVGNTLVLDESLSNSAP